MLEYERFRGARHNPGQEAFRRAFQLEKASRAVAMTLVYRGGQMWDLVRQRAGLVNLVYLQPDLEQPERFLVLGVFGNVIPDSRKQRRPQKSLIAGDRIRHAD